MYMRKSREGSEFVQEEFISLPDKIYVPLNIVRPPKEQDVQSNMEDPIGDCSMIPHGKYLRPFHMLITNSNIARRQRWLMKR